jgi:hypothetical protein
MGDRSCWRKKLGAMFSAFLGEVKTGFLRPSSAALEDPYGARH